MVLCFLAGCLPKIAVKDPLFFSDKERDAFFKKDECNPLLGALVNKSDNEVLIQIFKKENDSWKLISKIELRPRLENNAVCKEGKPIYLKYFLLPDYGTYAISMTNFYKVIIEGEEAVFLNKKNLKFKINTDNKCDLDLRIGWLFEIIN